MPKCTYGEANNQHILEIDYLSLSMEKKWTDKEA
jgi:hypothetical protein